MEGRSERVSFRHIEILLHIKTLIFCPKCENNTNIFKNEEEAESNELVRHHYTYRGKHNLCTCNSINLFSFNKRVVT